MKQVVATLSRNCFFFLETLPLLCVEKKRKTEYLEEKEMVGISLTLNFEKNKRLLKYEITNQQPFIRKII